MTVVHHVLSAAALSADVAGLSGVHFHLTHRVLDPGHGTEIKNASCDSSFQRLSHQEGPNITNDLDGSPVFV